MSDVLSSLKSAPELLDLPAQVDEVKTHVAEFGARLKDLKDRVQKLEEENTAEAAATSNRQVRTTIIISSCFPNYLKLVIFLRSPFYM